MDKDRTSDDYRACFNTDPGRRVLGHLLADGGYFDTDLTPERLEVQNFVKGILKEINRVPANQNSTVKVDDVSAYVNSMFSVGK